MDRYRRRLTSFNDDIQGTAGVVVAGILSALRLLGEPFSEQRIVFVGSGAAGIGIARLVRAAMLREGAEETTVHRAMAMLDSHGLVFEGRTPLDDDKREMALGLDELSFHGFDEREPADRHDLESVIRHVKPTILVGTTGKPNTFTEPAIRAMAENARMPIVMPLSNPTSLTEADPADLIAWTDGRAIVATGSPFPPIMFEGRERVIGQANNAYIFPGLGLGAIVSQTREVTDDMFLAAAETLASCVDQERLDDGALYPSQGDLRSVSRRIAIRVVTEARDQGLGLHLRDDEIESAVDAAIWEPAYT